MNGKAAKRKVNRKKTKDMRDLSEDRGVYRLTVAVILKLPTLLRVVVHRYACFQLSLNCNSRTDT